MPTAPCPGKTNLGSMARVCPRRSGASKPGASTGTSSSSRPIPWPTKRACAPGGPMKRSPSPASSARCARQREEPARHGAGRRAPAATSSWMARATSKARASSGRQPAAHGDAGHVGDVAAQDGGVVEQHRHVAADDVDRGAQRRRGREPAAGDRPVEVAGRGGGPAGDGEPHEELLVEAAHPRAPLVAGAAHPHLDLGGQVHLAHPRAQEGRASRGRRRRGAARSRASARAPRPTSRCALAHQRRDVGPVDAGQRPASRTAAPPPAPRRG